MFWRKKVPVELPLKEFISNFNITDAYNEHSDISTEYLVKKAPELVNIILGLENSQLEIKAVLITSNPQIVLMNAIKEEGLLFKKVENLFKTHERLPEFVIARICPLFIGLMRSDNGSSAEIAKYFVKFLPYVENQGVLSMYRVAFQKDNVNSVIERLLNLLELPKVIFNAINEFPNNKEHTYSCICITNLFCNSSVLIKQFKTKEFIYDIMKFAEDNVDIVSNETYTLLIALLDDRTKEYMMKILKNSFRRFRGNPKHLLQTDVAALKFITKMQSLKVRFTDVDENQHFEVVIRLFAQFPNSPFVANALTKYIEECLKDDVIFDSIFTKLLPAMIDFASYNDHNAMHMSCIFLLYRVQKHYGNTRQFHELMNQSIGYSYFFNYVLSEYIKIIKTPYGGKVNKHVKRRITVDDDIIIGR